MKPFPSTLCKTTIAPSLLAVSIVLFAPHEAYALKSYRCDGKIQFRPCGTELPGSRIISQNSRSNRDNPEIDPINAKIPGTRFARIDEPTFSTHSKGTGMWKGFIEGNGKINLTLQILQNGELLESRAMGQTYLLNSKTTFTFTSPLPRVAGWTWNVVATAS